MSEKFEGGIRWSIFATWLDHIQVLTEYSVLFFKNVGVKALAYFTLVS
jgi:hypothetical protein